MNRKLAIALAAVLIALPFAGCVENMADLRERLQTESSTDDVQPGATGDENGDDTGDETPAAVEREPPIARITIFSELGMRLYQADADGTNEDEPVMVVDPGTFTLTAMGSEVREPDAELMDAEWNVAGQRLTGPEVEVTLTEPGSHRIHLTVTDSWGSEASQYVHLGIRPQPFQVTTNLTGGTLIGLGGQDPTDGLLPLSESQTFTVHDAVDGMTVRAPQVRVTLDPGSPIAEGVLTVTDPNGNSVTRNNAGAGGTESIVLEPAPVGEWTITVALYSGATEEWTANVQVTYVEVIPELGDEGPGGHEDQDDPDGY